MYPVAVVKLTVALQAVHRFRHAAVIFERDLLRLHTAPEPFHNNVIETAATSSHADEHPTGSQRCGKGEARQLGSLIGGEDFRLRSEQCALPGGEANTAVQG